MQSVEDGGNVEGVEGPSMAPLLQLPPVKRERMGIFPEVQRFLEAHRECGEVTKEAGRPSPKGYRIHVACPCGAVLDRWVTPAAARHDLVHTNLLATRN
jgi:hypothetical protein